MYTVPFLLVSLLLSSVHSTFLLVSLLLSSVHSTFLLVSLLLSSVHSTFLLISQRAYTAGTTIHQDSKRINSCVEYVCAPIVGPQDIHLPMLTHLRTLLQTPTYTHRRFPRDYLRINWQQDGNIFIYPCCQHRPQKGQGGKEVLTILSQFSNWRLLKTSSPSEISGLI